MVIFKPYSSIKDFLQRFTLLKFGKLHIRLHKIVDKDNTSLFHNHPFHYISIILKGGYKEIILDQNNLEYSKTHNLFSVIVRRNNIYHRIIELKNPTITLFIAYGKYNWNAIQTSKNLQPNGLFQRTINNKVIWSKRHNGIWYIGNIDKNVAQNETRHSIHQIISN